MDKHINRCGECVHFVPSKRVTALMAGDCGLGCLTTRRRGTKACKKHFRRAENGEGEKEDENEEA